MSAYEGHYSFIHSQLFIIFFKKIFGLFFAKHISTDYFLPLFYHPFATDALPFLR